LNILFYKKTILSYLFLSIISFFLSLALLTPVKIIAEKFIPSLQIADIKFSHLKGNLWLGSLKLSYKNKLKTKLNWSISLTNIFNAQPVTKIKLTTKQSQLNFTSNFQGLTPALSIQGKLDSQEISSQIKLPNQAKMNGLIHIKNINIQNKPPYYINNGELLWDGGTVSANRNKNRLPALGVLLEQNGEHLVSYVTENSNKQSLIEIVASNDKQAEIKVTQRLLSLTKQGKLSDDESEFVIRFTEQLKF